MNRERFYPTPEEAEKIYQFVIKHSKTMAADKWRLHPGVIERILFDMGHTELVAPSWLDRFSKPLSGKKYTPRLESKHVTVVPVSAPISTNVASEAHDIMNRIRAIVEENKSLKEENQSLKEQLKNNDETPTKMATAKQLKYLSQLTGGNYSGAEMTVKECSLRIDAAKGQRAEKALGMVK